MPNIRSYLLNYDLIIALFIVPNVYYTMKIINRSAVVTGASGGIGYAIAEKLVDRGIGKIAIVDISDKCEKIAEKLNKLADQEVAIGFSGDVTSSDFRRTVFDTMSASFAPINICIPAAGIVRDGLSVKANKNSGEITIYPENDFEKILNVNLTHPTYWAMEMIASVARYRADKGLKKWQAEEEIQGVNILIGSVSSRGNRGQVGYAAAKSGLVGVSATLNLEGLFHGVQTKIIHPGFVDTPMVETIDNEYFETNLKPMIGLGRKIQPREIADIVCSMIENPAISGQVWADASMAPLA